MFTEQDLRNLLAILRSDRLTLRGSEAAGVALLAQKIEDLLNAPTSAPETDETG